MALPANERCVFGVYRQLRRQVLGTQKQGAGAKSELLAVKEAVSSTF